MTGHFTKRVASAVIAAALAAGAGAPAFAQGGSASGTGIPDEPVSREVVQPLPPQAATDLSEALRKLGTNGKDGPALLKAGWASLELDNADAAIGFFARAEAVPAVAAEARAGLGAVLVERKRPVDAIQYFNEAEAAGAKLGVHAAQRGLAYDLVGDNARAQAYYREALAVKSSDEVIRWLALSQAIGGDQNGSETTLLPLLQHRDLAAYRTRAFALAALGKTEEAVSIANAVMPASLASRISPYLRYMPKLTRAQQAAAGIYGHFPEADAIGQDDPRIAEYASGARPTAVALNAVDARLTPTGAPLGQAPKPAAPPKTVEVKVAKSGQEPQPSFSLTPSGPPAKPPAPARLADAFADFSLQKTAAAPAEGAVDITKIEPAREAAKKAEDDAKKADTKAAEAKAAKEKAAKEKAKKPVNPSRIWVQVASGRDRDALGFDWRRFMRENSKQFSGRKGYVVKWGKSNRLVTGPFANQKEATSFVTKLKKAEITAFSFTSDEGEAVDPVPGG